MVHNLLCELLTSVQAAEHFVLFWDEIRAISNKVQFTISMRWATHGYMINDDELLTLAEVQQTDGATLTAILKHVLICNDHSLWMLWSGICRSFY